MFSLYKFFVILLMMIAALITADQVFGLKLGTERITQALTITPPAKNIPKPADPETVVHPQEVHTERAPADKREWVVDGVKIDGKVYPYNPRNVYMVNGVATYYDPGRKAKVNKETGEVEGNTMRVQPVMQPTQAQGPAPGKAAKTVEFMAEKAPLSVYSPQGVNAVMEGARDAARMRKENEKALEALDREGNSP